MTKCPEPKCAIGDCVVYQTSFAGDVPTMGKITSARYINEEWIYIIKLHHAFGSIKESEIIYQLNQPNHV